MSGSPVRENALFLLQVWGFEEGPLDLRTNMRPLVMKDARGRVVLSILPQSQSLATVSYAGSDATNCVDVCNYTELLDKIIFLREKVLK